MRNDKTKLIKPQKILSDKTGRGGLSESVIHLAEANIETLKMSAEMALQNQISVLKNHIQQDDLITTKSKTTLENFIFDLLPLKTDSALSSNKTIALLSSNLLSFVETLDTMNIDAYHIIRAHVNAMHLAIEKNISDDQHPFVKSVVDELTDACDRYHNKYIDAKPSSISDVRNQGT